MNNLNLEKYDENYIFKLMELSFKYYDANIEKDKYEDDVDSFISEFNMYKSNETKANLKYMIEFIEKYWNIEEFYLEENLKVLSKIVILFRFNPASFGQLYETKIAKLRKIRNNAFSYFG